MAESLGWFLDAYDHPDDGVVVWILDDSGARLRLRQDFPVTFYAAGASPRLRRLWQFIEAQPIAANLSRQERRDLFSAEPLVVLAIQVLQAAQQQPLFRKVTAEFPDLTYYDADLPLALRYAAACGAFSLARCRHSSRDGQLTGLEIIDSPWDLDPPIAPIDILYLEPDQDPAHAPPAHITIRKVRGVLNDSPILYRLPLQPERPLLINLRAILKRHDPDLLLTTWGDTWLLAHLMELSRRWHIPLPLNRDPTRRPSLRRERTYYSYGQVIYRGPQIHLFGRWHVDRANAMLYDDYGLDGVYELARVTSLSLQTVARASPGSGISAMQVLTALRHGILVPWRKQQAERLKSANDMLRADQGGLVYQPTIGLHRDVAAVDFISMYPSIMAHFNISPETVGVDSPLATHIPQLGLCINQERRGLVPQTLEPLLEKRLALKAQLACLPQWDPRRRPYKARASAHKWLLVTCFGYLGYKNARFGRIEAHEAVTAYGRDALLSAKEAAEDLGGQVLHMYVDGLWIQIPGASAPADFQALLDEIAIRTGLSIALDGVYRWVAFLPSRLDERMPVANRYFGVFQDGSLKVRGIEARRRDTPPFIVDAQMEILETLARAENASELPAYLPAIVSSLQRKLSALRRGRVHLKELMVTQKLSRNLEEYRSPSPPARAAAQMEAAGKPVRKGQHVRFIYTLGEPGVAAWDVHSYLDPATVDVARYVELLVRAAVTVLWPLGIEERQARDWLYSNAGYMAAPGRLSPIPAGPFALDPALACLPAFYTPVVPFAAQPA